MKIFMNLKDIKKYILNKNGIIIEYIFKQNKKNNYFAYMLNGKFGYIQQNSTYGLSISSCYYQSKDFGSGSLYKTSFTISEDDIKNAPNFYTKSKNGKIPKMYKSLTEFIENEITRFGIDANIIQKNK